MASQVNAPEVPVYVVGESNNIAVSFVGVLDIGELITGTPTVTEITTSDLTFANTRVNTSAVRIGDDVIPVGKAVQFKCTGQGTSNSPYTLKITAVTDSSPAQTKIRGIDFTVEDIT